MNIQEWGALSPKTSLRLPLYQSSVEAGFPSPADDYVDRSLDLNEHLVRHPAATFFVRVQGDSMVDAQIFSGDLLLVDRALEAQSGDVVVALLDGEFTVKRFVRDDQQVILQAANADYPNIVVAEHMHFEIWGVVAHVIHSLRST